MKWINVRLEIASILGDQIDGGRKFHGFRRVPVTPIFPGLAWAYEAVLAGGL